MSKPLVSVVITCYNLGQYLVAALQSVLAQTYPQVEVIIVNDGSNERQTLTVLASLAGTKSIKIINLSNGGAARARNQGIKQAKGEYICCLDADDKLHPDYLSKCMAVFLSRGDATNLGIVSSDYRCFGQSREYVQVSDYNPIALAACGQLHVSSVFKKSCWSQVGGYWQQIAGHEDWEFWLRLVAAGFTWQVVKEPIFYYRRRRNSKFARSNKKRQLIREQIYTHNQEFYQKHAPEIIAYLQELNYQHAKILLKFKHSFLGGIYTNCKAWLKKYE